MMNISRKSLETTTQNPGILTSQEPFDRDGS